MARQNGRDLVFESDGELIAVLTTKTVNINNNPVDVTGDDDQGFVTLLERPGTKQITFDATGVTDNETLRDRALVDGGATLIEAARIVYLNADGSGDEAYVIEGDFYMASYSETGASDGRVEFTASFQSTGAFTKGTPVPPGP